MTLAIVHGEVAHRRTRPAVNAFCYPAFCLRIPLSRMSELPARGVALNARGALSFRERDHGARDGTPLLTWIRQLLARERIAADGEIVLYAFPRMFGYVFNPVCFWVCHDRGHRVHAVLAEVNNTYGETHHYLLAHPDGCPLASGETLTTRKMLHVSPFCALQGHYAFRFHFGPDRWLARIDYFDDAHNGDALLETRIAGACEPLERAAAQRLLWRYRGFTLAVIARIHWQALRLWAKRVPSMRKPEPPGERLSRN
jgi:DUF1365 family protein